MSSDGSSGITQFGLYRTIDARTEEFLRLSRRRQIRQGCACAAVSTAITVTVVVSVLLVYEYSIISGSSKNKSYVTKPNWLGFINDSADTTPFDAKYTKAKLNLDKTTIKLLPILLKALKQNIFFEKVIEDYTSANPLYEPSDTTEQNYEKNIFSDPRNWFKAPPSRLYAIEFKTSPLVYYQPTRNLEYMTKIRKIRDYKRILNYFEKMINDKVNFGSNMAMIKRELQTEPPSKPQIRYISTTPIKKVYKIKEKPRIESINKNVKYPVMESKNCKCPIKLGDMLKKLMGNINQLLPYSKIPQPKLCNEKKPIKSIHFPPKIIKNDFTTKFTTLKPINVITTPNFLEKIVSGNVHLTFQDDMKKEISQNNGQSNKINLTHLINTVKNENFTTESAENRIDKYEKPTTVKNYLEATESIRYKPHTTKPMTSAMNKLSNFMYHHFHDDLISSTSTVATNKLKNKPTLSNEEYDDYFINTQKSSTNYDILDVHNLELIKTKIFSPKNSAKKLKHKSEVVTKKTVKLPRPISDPNFIPIPQHKNPNFSFENRINNIFLQKLTNKKPKVRVQKEKTKAPKTEKPTEVYRFDHIVHNENQFGYDDKVIDEEIFEEYKIKQSSKTSEVESNNNQTETTATPKPADFLKDNMKEKTEINENLPKKVKSMVPLDKPIYLEIQRNDWKQDDSTHTDTHDYDFNVILLIYEYAIAVEWNLVQRRIAGNTTDDSNIHDHPIADRLDRSYFGFDQDYYERMPLLVNAMQEKSYLDPLLEVIPASKHNNYIHTLTTTPKNYRTNSIKRTSPRPFFFEYRSPTPLPFSKKYGSRTWVEKYRNAQRLQNIRQIIKYLEKTINAKAGDMHTKSPSTHIAFTGMYVEPMINVSGTNRSKTEVDLVFKSTTKSEITHSNHQSDPLFLFKPENPGEVNLLADGFLRFSPVPAPIPDISTVPPMLKKRDYNNRTCNNINCEEKLNNILFRSSDVLRSTESPPTTKSFSVMLNLFPLKSISDVDVKKDNIKKSQVNLNNIYFTTTRPTVHFKRKPIVPIRRTFIRRKSRVLYQNKTNSVRKNYTDTSDIDNRDQEAGGTDMIVHVKVYSPEIKTESGRIPDTVDTTTESFTPILIQPTPPYTTETPFILSTSQVEDFHVGSSGIIPIEDRITTPPLPKVTTILPFIDTTVTAEVNSFTTPPDILKFSHEDAKIPQEYINIRDIDVGENRRNFKESHNNYEDNAHTIVVKPKDVFEITKTTTEAPNEITEEFEGTTTAQTYVPQINGHYRSIGQNLKNFSVTPESIRKRRLELALNGFRKPTYVPMYVEIRRNNTKNRDGDE